MISGRGIVLIDDDIVTGQNDFLKLVIEAARANMNITPRELVKEVDLSHNGPGTRYVNHLDDEEESLDMVDDMNEKVDGEEKDYEDREFGEKEYGETEYEEMERGEGSVIMDDSAGQSAAMENGDNVDGQTTNDILSPPVQPVLETKPSSQKDTSDKSAVERDPNFGCDRPERLEQ